MEKTILIAGKDFPDGKIFAETVSAKRKTAVTSAFSGSPDKTVLSDRLVSFEWNRISPAACHSLILRCENEFSMLNSVILYFDETQYAQQLTDYSQVSCEKALSEMTASYQYLAMDYISRCESKYVQGTKPANLVFLYKTPTRTVSNMEPVNPFLIASAASFAAFSESCAVTFGNRASLNIVMVHADASAENARTDDVLASWLCGYLDMIDELKVKLTPKQSCLWVKPGAKSPGSFTLFH